MNIQIGKLYQTNCSYDLIYTDSWSPGIHKCSHHKKGGTVLILDLMPQDRNKVSVKVLTDDGKIGWIRSLECNLDVNLTLISLPQK